MATLNEASGRAWACVVHGVFLGIACAWFQSEKLHYAAFWLDVTLPPGGASTSLLPEVAVGGAVAGTWLLLSRWQTPLGNAVWRFGFLNSLLVFYALLVADHRFFLVTRTPSSGELLVYSMQHVWMLRDLVQFHGSNPQMLMQVAAVPIWLLAATWISERWCLWSPGWKWGALWVVLGGVVPAATRGNDLGAVASSLWVELARSGPQARAFAARVEGVEVPPLEYEAPQVLEFKATPDIYLLILESVPRMSVPPHLPRDRWDELPTLSRLANEGRVYDAAYGTVTHTSKALVGLFCGAWPRLAMAVRESRPGGLGSLICLPELLEAGGYRSIFLQSALGSFERFGTLMENMGFNNVLLQEDLPEGEAIGYLGMDERIMLEPALSWVDAQGTEPVFLSLITVSTHDPYLAPGMEPTGIPAVDHAEALKWSDAFLGDFLSGLEERGRLENALVIVVSDHGEGLGKGNRRFHDAVPFEEGVRIPLLLWGPGLGLKPGRDAGLRSQLDVLPTVLGLVGSWKGTLPGGSLLEADNHDVVFSSCWYSDYCMTMRQGDDSWIYWYGRRATQLFDLNQDPNQERDLALSVSADRVREAEDALLGWRLSVEDWWEAEARP
jgi:hypothetical protein